MFVLIFLLCILKVHAPSISPLDILPGWPHTLCTCFLLIMMTSATRLGKVEVQEWWWCCWGIQVVMLMMMSVTCRKRDRRAGGESRSHKARWDAIRRLQRGVSEQIREYRREWRGRKKSDEVRIGHKGSWKSATNRRVSLSLSQENWHKWHSCAKI